MADPTFDDLILPQPAGPALYGAPTFDDLIPAQPAVAAPYGAPTFDDLIPAQPAGAALYGAPTFDDLIPAQPAGAAPYGAPTFNDLIPPQPVGAAPYGAPTFDDLIPTQPAVAAHYGAPTFADLIPPQPTSAAPFGELTFGDQSPNPAAPWQPPLERNRGVSSGQTIGNAVAAHAAHKSEPDRPAESATHGPSIRAWFTPQDIARFESPTDQNLTGQVSAPQLNTARNSEAHPLQPTTSPPFDSHIPADPSAASPSASQSSGAVPSSRIIMSPLGGVFGADLLAGIASNSLITKAADGSTYAHDGDPIVGKLIPIGQTIVSGRYPEGAYATPAGAIANVVVDWAGHVYHQFFMPDKSGGYAASNNTSVELPRALDYIFFNRAGEMISYTPYTDGTPLRGHVNYYETYDNTFRSGIRLIPLSKPNFDQLDQIESSPIGGALYAGASLLGASPSEQQGWLNVGSMLEGIGASLVRSPDAPLTILNDGQAAHEPIAIDKPYANPGNRPPYAPGQVSQVWENAMDGNDEVRDPNTGETLSWNPLTSRNGQWDMGHRPGQDYNTLWRRYMTDQISLHEFLRIYRNPDAYRPESPSSNRSRNTKKPLQ